MTLLKKLLFFGLLDAIAGCSSTNYDLRPPCIPLDPRMVKFYFAKNCTPIDEEGECPYAWDCSKWDEETDRQSRLPACFDGDKMRSGCVPVFKETAANDDGACEVDGWACPGEEVKNACSPTKCPNYATLDSMYRAKACKPILKEGECCPSSWDCSRWEETLAKRDECFAVSGKYPEGKYYNIGDEMHGGKSQCNVGCTCMRSYKNEAEAEAACIMLGCAVEEHYGSKCIYDKRDWGNCCPGDTICDSDLEGRAVCKDGPHGSKVYYEGEVFTPLADPCLRCICRPGYDQTDPDATADCYRYLIIHTHCYELANIPASRMNCYDQDRLTRGCLPIFDGDQCCPWRFKCPGEEGFAELETEYASGKRVQVKTPKP